MVKVPDAYFLILDEKMDGLYKKELKSVNSYFSPTFFKQKTFFQVSGQNRLFSRTTYTLKFGLVL
jgi:hypothetical protein